MVWTKFQPIFSRPSGSYLSGGPTLLRFGCCCLEVPANFLPRPEKSLEFVLKRLPARNRGPPGSDEGLSSLSEGRKQMKAWLICHLKVHPFIDEFEGGE